MKKVFIISIISLTVIVSVIYIFFQDEIKYFNEEFELLDTFADTTESGIYRFYFINVSSIEKDFINYTSKRLIEPKINNSGNQGILIAHFYNLSDTMPLPPKMFKQLRYKYPNRNNFDKNLRYIIRGAVKTYFCNSTNFEDTLFYNHMVVPKYGVSAKNVLK